MRFDRRRLAVLAAALLMASPAPAATPQPMNNTWVRIAAVGNGACVSVSTTDSLGATFVTTSPIKPASGDIGRVVSFMTPLTAYATADLWAKGPAGSVIAVDTGLCAGGGAVASGGGGITPSGGLAADLGDPLNFIILF